MDKAIVAAALMLALSGCVTTGSLCSAGPIILDPGAAERWTRSEKEQVSTLNNSGVSICKWRAP